MAKYIPMRAMVLGLVVGSIVTIVNLIIVLEMAQQCVFLHVPGPWIVVSVHEQEPGRPEELLHDFLQR